MNRITTQLKQALKDSKDLLNVPIQEGEQDVFFDFLTQRMEFELLSTHDKDVVRKLSKLGESKPLELKKKFQNNLGIFLHNDLARLTQYTDLVKCTQINPVKYKASELIANWIKSKHES